MIQAVSTRFKRGWNRVAGSRYPRLSVVHAHEKETMRWSGRPDLTAIARSNRLLDACRISPAAPHLDQRADDGADHVTEEAFAGDLKSDERATPRHPIARRPGSRRPGSPSHI